MTVTKQSIADALNRYCFNNIWNEPTSEYRCNIRPYRVNTRSYGGFCYFGDVAMSLPNRTSTYFVYRFTMNLSSGIINIPTNTWMTCTELCNEHDVLLHVYTPSGRMAHKSACWVYVDKATGIISLAVTRSMMSKISEDKVVYITIYADSDVVGNTTIYNDPNEVASIINTSDPDKISLFINGYNYSTTKFSKYQSGDHLELIYDEDIIGAFNIPVTTSPNTYYSSSDQLYKEIVHIPKSLNEDNKIITYNTCSFYARTLDHKGTYIPSVYPEESSIQLSPYQLEYIEHHSI